MCRRYYLDSVDPVSAQEANDLDRADTETITAYNKSLGLRRHDTGGKTCFRLVGPLPIDFSNGIGTHHPGRNHRIIGSLPSLRIICIFFVKFFYFFEKFE